MSSQWKWITGQNTDTLSRFCPESIFFFLHRQEFVVMEFLRHLFTILRLLLLSRLCCYVLLPLSLNIPGRMFLECSINEYVIDTRVSRVFRFYKPSLKILIRPISVSSSICLVLSLRMPQMLHRAACFTKALWLHATLTLTLENREQ